MARLRWCADNLLDRITMLEEENATIRADRDEIAIAYLREKNRAAAGDTAFMRTVDHCDHWRGLYKETLAELTNLRGERNGRNNCTCA